METDVHLPTDINLLYEKLVSRHRYDAMRKVITLMARWSDEHDLSYWRQHAYNIRQLKRLMRAAQNKKRSKAKSEEQKKKNEALIVKAHQAYLDTASHELNKARDTLATLDQRGYTSEVDEQKQREIEGFMQHAIRQIDQTRRRVMLGETIPHAEKVFSIFEPHTEWISKGKAGVPVELGVKVCILEDQHQFISGRIERTIGASGIAQERQAIATGADSRTNRSIPQSPPRALCG